MGTTRGKSQNLGGGGAIARTMPEGWYTRGQAAELIGRSKDTLREWQKHEVLVPSGFVERGALIMWAYSEDDIEAGKVIASEMKPGRKPKEEVEALAEAYDIATEEGMG